MHISGLEVEGRHPRALMESALLLLNRSSASKAQPPIRLERSRSTRLRHHSTLVQSQEKLFPLGGPAVRLIVSKKRPDDARILIRHGTQAFAVPSFFCFSAIHLLRASSFLEARNTTDREPCTSSVRR